MTSYAATTTNATNSVTATASDSSATVTLMLDGAVTTSPVTWSDGENILSIEVQNGDEVKTYTVTVTKS